MDGAMTQLDDAGTHTFDGLVDPEGLPEYFLKVRGIEVDGDRATAEVETGPWLSWNSGAGSAGSLGVLFDNVLAYAMLNGSPCSSSLVSSEITLDAVAPIPVDGQRLTVVARRVHRDSRTAFATAELCTAAGAPVALATQRGRFIPHPPPPAFDYQLVEASSGTSGLADLMWPDSAAPDLTSDGRIELFVSPRLGNHMNNLHGGLSLLMAEWSATAAVRARGSDLAGASVRVGYSRPLPVGGTVTFHTSVLHLGRTTAHVTVVGRTETGKCGIVATVTLG